MADNIILNSGSGGETCATDDVLGVQYQRIKLTDGTADSTTPINAGHGTAANALRVELPTDGTGVIATVGAVTAITNALPAGTNAIGKLAANSGVDIGDVDVLTINGVAPAFGTGVRAATVQRVTIATDDVVPASQSGTWNITNVSGTVSLPTGAATAAKQPALGTAGAASADVITVQGIASMTALKTDGSAVTQPVSGTVTANLSAGTNTNEVVGDAAHDAAAAGNPVLTGAYASAAAPTDVSADGDAVRLWALRSGAQAVQPTFAGVLGVAGNGASGTGVQRVTLANDSTGVLATVSTVTTVSTLTGGGVAHDSADSGNPVKVGAKCSLTLSDDTIVANADRTDLTSDGDGALLIRPQFPLGDLISEALSNTDGASTASTNFGAVASTRSYITAIHAFRTDSGTTPAYIDFRDGTGGSVLYRIVLPPNGGAVLPAGATPYFRTSANTALAFDVSAALTTVYLSLTGFKSKV